MICHWSVDNNTAGKELTSVQEESWTYLQMSAYWLILHRVSDCVAHLYKQHTAHIIIFCYSCAGINTLTIMLGCLQFLGRQKNVPFWHTFQFRLGFL